MNSQITGPKFDLGKNCAILRIGEPGQLLLLPLVRLVAGHTEDRVTQKETLSDKLGPVLIPWIPSFIFGKCHQWTYSVILTEQSIAFKFKKQVTIKRIHNFQIL